MTETMTGAQFRSLREYLGLDQEWLADRLDVGERTVRRWEAGAPSVPAGVREQMLEWETTTEDAVEQHASQLLAQRAPKVSVSLDGTYAADDAWPPRWRRHVMTRVAAVIPGLVIDYTPSADD